MSGHGERGWVPSDFVDEDGPAPRAHPTDWLVPVDGGGVGLDRRWADDDPRPLAEGERADFDWTIGDLGESEVKIVVEAGERRIVVDPPPPEAPPGTRLLVWEPFDPDTVNESVEGLAAEWDEGESGFVRFFVWSEKAVPFVVRGGRFIRATPFRCGDTVVHLPSGETWTGRLRRRRSTRRSRLERRSRPLMPKSAAMKRVGDAILWIVQRRADDGIVSWSGGASISEAWHQEAKAAARVMAGWSGSQGGLF